MTPTQQRLMIYLASRVDATFAEIKEALQISMATFHLANRELLEDDYVRSTKIGSRNVCRYRLTEDGLSVANRLIRYAATDGQIVQPNRMNKLEGLYVPSVSYQRNNAHKDIGRVGVPC
jgi:DNA-binding MarR family transcriptional regulator